MLKGRGCVRSTLHSTRRPREIAHRKSFQKALCAIALNFPPRKLRALPVFFGSSGILSALA
jgi:Mn-containing catalase